MNHVNVEEVEAQPDAVIGKFLVKSFTAIILFDTGALHSYISRGFVDKYKLPTKVLRTCQNRFSNKTFIEKPTLLSDQYRKILPY